MPRFRILVCMLALAFAAPGCDSPPQPPEPTIDIGEKVDRLGAELQKTRAEARKRVDLAGEVDERAKDAGRASGPDAEGR